VLFSSPERLPTIGYGYPSPATDQGKIFCIMFMAIGVPYFAYMTTVLSQNINQMLDDLRSLLACSELTIKTLYILGGFLFIIYIPCKIFMAIEGWSFVDSVYFSFISLSTIGFGDLVPSNDPPVC